MADSGLPILAYVADLLVLKQETDKLLCFGMELVDFYGQELFRPKGVYNCNPEKTYAVGSTMLDEKGNEYEVEGKVFSNLEGNVFQEDIAIETFEIVGWTTVDALCLFSPKSDFYKEYL